MKKVILFLIVVSASFSVSAFELMSLKDFLKSELSGLELSKETFQLSGEQKEKIKSIAPNASEESFTFYYGRDKEGKITRSCLSIAQQGKEGPMTLGACYDEKGLLAQVKILTHHEEKGKAIEEMEFLKQFKGKSTKDPFKVGEDVAGISGATWSSKAVAEALRKASFAHKSFVKGK